MIPKVIVALALLVSAATAQPDFDKLEGACNFRTKDDCKTSLDPIKDENDQVCATACGASETCDAFEFKAAASEPRTCSFFKCKGGAVIAADGSKGTFCYPKLTPDTPDEPDTPDLDGFTAEDGICKPAKDCPTNPAKVDTNSAEECASTCAADATCSAFTYDPISTNSKDQCRFFRPPCEASGTETNDGATCYTKKPGDEPSFTPTRQPTGQPSDQPTKEPPTCDDELASVKEELKALKECEDDWTFRYTKRNNKEKDCRFATTAGRCAKKDIRKNCCLTCKVTDARLEAVTPAPVPKKA